MAFDLRECMGSHGVSVGLTGFRLWGFVGILVRRPDSGLHRLPAVPVGMVSQSGGPAGQRSSRRHKWPSRCRDGCTPRRIVVLTWRLRGAAVVQAGVSGCIARTCRAVPGRSSGQGRRATRPWAGRREVAEACRSAEHGAHITGPGPGHARCRSPRWPSGFGPSVRPRAGRTGIAGYFLGLTAVGQVSRGSPGGPWIGTGGAAWTWSWTRSAGSAPG